MTKRAFDKIMAGLKDAAAGRWSKATLFDGGRPVQRYTLCQGCSGLTLTVRGRCESCGNRKITSELRQGESK